MGNVIAMRREIEMPLLRAGHPSLKFIKNRLPRRNEVFLFPTHKNTKSKNW